VQKRSCVGGLLCEDCVEGGSPLGIGRLGFRSRFHPEYTRGYNALSRDAHLLMIARSGQWIGAFPTYDFHHAHTHIWFLLGATVKYFRGHRTGLAKLGKVLNCWQISRLWDRNRGSRNQPDGRRHREDREQLRSRPTCRQSAREGEVRCHFLNEGVMVFEIPISPQGRGWPRDGEREE
jgi:hypothetical protein